MRTPNTIFCKKTNIFEDLSVYLLQNQRGLQEQRLMALPLMYSSGSPLQMHFCNNCGVIDLKDFEEVVVVCIDTTWYL